MSTSSVSSSSSSSGINVSSNSSGTLQVTGLASGLDTNQIITELMQIQQQPVTALQNQEKGLTARNTALTTVQTALQKVVTDSRALLDPSLFDTSQAVTSSDATRVSATSSTGAGVGGYQVSVTQLANSAQRTYGYTSPTSDTTITIDGHDTTIKAGESISDFVNSINSDSSATVYAAATDSGTVVLSDRQTGDFGTSFIAVTGAGGILAEDTTKAKEGKDALFSVDGKDGQSHSNTVTNGIAGVSLTLNGVTTTTGPVTVNVAAPAPNPSTVQSAINTFVTDYNSALNTIQTQLSTVPSSSDPTVGTLYDDQELQGLLASMRTAMYGTVSGTSGITSMLDIGVSTGATTGSGAPSSSAIAGNLTLDATKLTSALQSNPDGVQQMLIGWANSFSNVVGPDADAGGTITQRINGDSSEISSMDQRIADMQQALSDKQAQLTQQFADLEAALSSNQSQSSWLTSQIASLPTFSA